MRPSGDPDFVDEPPPPSRPDRLGLAVALAGALLGVLFSAQSTADFMQHLDREVHAISCSFIPGAARELGESGCRTVMMSPYSSFFREALWGGVPVALWALAVFAFLSYRAGFLLWRGNAPKSDTRFLLAAAALPAAMSVIYGYLSMAKLDATCKVCLGMYLASAVCLAGAVLAHRRAREDQDPAANRRFALGFLEGVAFVGALSLAYVAFVPETDPEKTIAGCGGLIQESDPAGVMIPLRSGKSGVASIEVLDPLCPACKAFDARLSASSLRGRLELKAVLFPLDSKCNWMVTEALHPGACAVSEAVLCAAGLDGSQKDAAAAQEVLEWAFENQEDLRALAAQDEAKVRGEIERRFPKVKGCLGSYLVKNKLTKSLRWAVANAIPVLTPQLFVGPTRMCEEDTDLGLEYTLSRMLAPEALEAARKRQPPPRPKPVAPVAERRAAAPVSAESPRSLPEPSEPSEPDEEAAEPEETTEAAAGEEQ